LFSISRNGGQSQPGIIPQAIYECFEAVNTFPNREFLLRVSYLEVYNEQIKDLLSTEPVNIKIQHDPKLGTVITGHKEQVVLSPEQVRGYHYQLLLF
jgi:centromeric protein E